MHDAVMASILEGVLRSGAILVVMLGAHEIITRNRLINILIAVGLGTVFGFFGSPAALRIEHPFWALSSSLCITSVIYFPLAWVLKRWGPWPINPKAERPKPREGYPPHFPKAAKEQLDSQKRGAEGRGDGAGDS
jgi:hypothetical protein